MVTLAMRGMMPYREVVEAVLDSAGASADPAQWRVLSSGSAHLIVAVGDSVSVRVAKNPEAGRSLARHTRVLALLPEYDVAVPRPLSPVISRHGHTAVALTWLHGEHRRRGVPARPLGEVLEQLWATDTSAMEADLDRHGQHWGGHRRRRVMLDEVVPRLLPRNRAAARQAIAELADLETVRPRLVHSDLTGPNMLWDGDRLCGVLDWDHASLGDPAHDVASLAMWYGWDVLERVISPEMIHRARLHSRIMPMASVAYTLVQQMDTAQVNQAVERADDWIERRLR